MPPNCDLPAKSQIFEYWKNRLEKLDFFVDWGEPGCWACGFHYDAKYDIRRSNAPWRDVLKCWDKVPLQRCHIIPRSLGGANRASNLFLMCRECHDLAPNTTSRKIFFDWARRQRFWRREMAKMKSALESFGIEEAGLDALSDLMQSKNFKSWSRRRFGLHWPQSGYAPRSSRFTYATIVGLALEYQSVHQKDRKRQVLR
jgi:hypothetical protein